jgi:thiol-disulfide isomerase/thioredoxin
VIAAAPDVRPSLETRTVNQVTLRRAKLRDLDDLVRRQKGKVVAVDFWASYCLPCKKSFPRLVDLHGKHGQEGLVVVSVSLDDPDNKDEEVLVRTFLEKQKATFTNLLLDEALETWQQKLDITGPPFLHVYDRKGKLQRFDAENMDFAKFEKVIVQSLKRN